MLIVGQAFLFNEPIVRQEHRAGHQAEDQGCAESGAGVQRQRHPTWRQETEGKRGQG